MALDGLGVQTIDYLEYLKRYRCFEERDGNLGRHSNSIFLAPVRRRTYSTRVTNQKLKVACKSTRRTATPCENGPP